MIGDDMLWGGERTREVDLTGKVAIVTGSGCGLGLAYAKQLALAGAQVLVNDVDAEVAEAAVALKPYIDAGRDGGVMPPFARRALGFGTAQDAAGLVAFLASDAAAEITGQAIGIGGDRLSLWSHPEQIVAAYADGGWTPDAIAEVWPTVFAPKTQTVGEQLPEPTAT